MLEKTYCHDLKQINCCFVFYRYNMSEELKPCAVCGKIPTWLIERIKLELDGLNYSCADSEFIQGCKNAFVWVLSLRREDA